MDRTRLGRRIALVSLAAALPLSAAPAIGQGEDDFFVPDDAPVVAGPTPSGARLVAFDRRRQLCTGRLTGDTGGYSCGRPPRGIRDFGYGSSSDGVARVFSGAVAPEVAAIELVYPGGERVRTATSAGEQYTGRYAGRVRFFIVDGLGGEEPLYFRLTGADGGLLAVVDVSFGGAVAGPRATVARGRLGGSRWTLIAFHRRGLAPLPDERERITDRTCVGFQPRDRDDSHFFAQAEACADPDYPSGALRIGTDTSCGGLGRVVTGVVPARVDRVEAVLGDGTSARVRLRRLPERLGAYRAFALILGPDMAVRRIAAFDASRRVGSENLSLPPGRAECGSTSLSVFLFGVGAEEPPPAGPGGPTLLARDEGVLLCTALNRFTRAGSDCRPPPVDAEDVRTHTQRSAGGTFVAGVTAADVAAVELTLDGRVTQRVETSPEGPYEGRYRGRVRFFSAALPGRRLVHAVRAIDQNGRRRAVSLGPDTGPFERGPHTLARGSGGVRLSVALARRFAGPRRDVCLQLTTGRERPSSDHCGISATGLVEITARCSPRRVVLWGRLPARVSGVAVRTDRGLARGRVTPFPRRLGVRGRAFLLVLPRGAAARELVTTGRAAERQTLRLPSAAEQCGWFSLRTLRGPAR